MSDFEVIPAVDIRGGKCVRLEQGLAERESVYADDPLEAARLWERGGARRLHVVDLDGAFGGRSANFTAVRRIIEGVSVPVEVGGGIRDEEAVRRYLDAGARWVIMGTRAAEDPRGLSAIAQALPERIILGLDCRDGRVRTAGWTQEADLSAEDLLARLVEAPLAAVICTDTSKDGMLSGPSFDLLAAVAGISPWPVIASGGVTSSQHVERLAGMNIAGAIIGQALYRGVLRLEDALAAGRRGRREEP